MGKRNRRDWCEPTTGCSGPLPRRRCNRRVGQPVTDLRIPLGREGTPDEVAACVVFLASDEASYVTGANLNLSGGLFLDR